MTSDVAETGTEAVCDGAPGRGKFELTCDGPGWKALPVVNGHVVAASSADVHVDPESFPEVTLRFPAADAVGLGFSPAVIGVDEQTREALVSLGWTPPDAAPALVACPEEWTPEQIEEFRQAWDAMEGRHELKWLPPRPAMTVGATLTGVVCPGCSSAVPVQCGDVTGMDLDGMIGQAVQLAAAQCPEHATVSVGA